MGLLMGATTPQFATLPKGTMFRLIVLILILSCGQDFVLYFASFL